MYTFSSTHKILQAEHLCPALSNPEFTTSLTTCSGKAELSTIIQFKPPVSAIKLVILSCFCKFDWIIFAVFREPVNKTFLSFLSLITLLEINAPSPKIKAIEFLGNPAFNKSLIIKYAA